MSPTLLSPPRAARGANQERRGGLDTVTAMPRIVALSGSPSPDSKTAMVARQVLDDLQAAGHATHLLRLSDLDARALLRGDTAEPGVAQAVAALDAADGVIVATPIFKASCSGLLKAFLDLLPQFALAGKTVLPLATGGSPAHVLALDYGLRPILQSMGPRHIVQAVFVATGQLAIVDGRLALADDAQALLAEAVLHFRCSLRPEDRPVLLGHPRPIRTVPPEPSPSIGT